MYIWYLYNQPRLAGYDWSGWETVCQDNWTPNPDCEIGVGMWISNSVVTRPWCNYPLQPTNAPYGSAIPAGTGTVIIGRMASLPDCLSRFSMDEQRIRRTGIKPEVPFNPQVPGVVVLPDGDPFIWPWALQPHRIRHPQSEAGPKSRRRPKPQPRPLPNRGQRKQREEKKLGLTKAISIAQRFFHSLTETGDFVNALWEALPKELRTGKGLAGKIGDVIQHFDKIDASKALYNLVANQIEDALIGRLMRALDRAGVKVGASGQPYLKRW